MGPTLIDGVLTPIAGGIGGGLGMWLVARRQPEAFRRPGLVGLGVGVVVAAVLFAVRQAGGA